MKQESKMFEKKVINYESDSEAIVAIAKRLCVFEERYNQSSKDFFESYRSGKLEETPDFAEWSYAYEHFLAIHDSIGRPDDSADEEFPEPDGRRAENGLTQRR